MERCWQAGQPSNRTDWRDVNFLVVDGEMSSMETDTGELLSLGWVPIRRGRILLSEAQHVLFQTKGSVGDSAVIHQIRDCDLNNGLSLEDATGNFLQAAEGSVLVFHHAKLDLAFLNKISRHLYNAPLLLPVVDTLDIDLAMLKRRDVPIKKGALSLQGCRQRYYLPQYPAHNALMDAVATAELLLAQIQKRASGGRLALSALRV